VLWVPAGRNRGIDRQFERFPDVLRDEVRETGLSERLHDRGTILLHYPDGRNLRQVLTLPSANQRLAQ